MDEILSHYHQWGGVVVFALVGLLFLAFVPFYRKSQRKPAGVYAAFVVAFALEMFGVPMSVYLVTWVFGFTLPEGILWGHTLYDYIGYWGMYMGGTFMLVGITLVVLGWSVIFRRYWRHEEGSGELVTSGVYRYIRHPQYTGFLLVTLGMLLEWATIPLLVMWPILALLYYRLARKEEGYMLEQFGQTYADYRSETGMFLPPFRAPLGHGTAVSRG